MEVLDLDASGDYKIKVTSRTSLVGLQNKSETNIFKVLLLFQRNDSLEEKRILAKTVLTKELDYYFYSVILYSKIS